MTRTYDTRTCHHEEGPLHSCKYVEIRNRFIPQAWREAEASVTGMEPGGKREAAVTSAFFDAMNRLCNTPNAQRPKPVNGANGVNGHNRRYVS